MPPIDYKACCVFASVNPPDWQTADCQSISPPHKLYPDLLYPCCVHYCFCVLLRQNMGCVLQFLSCRELSCSVGFFPACLWPSHAEYLQEGTARYQSLACILISEWAAQQPGWKAHLGLGDLAEAISWSALEATLNCVTMCVVDGSNFRTAPKCKIK